MSARRIITGKDQEFQLSFTWNDTDPDLYPQDVYLDWCPEKVGSIGRIVKAHIHVGTKVTPQLIELCEYLNYTTESKESGYQDNRYHRYVANIATEALRKIAQTSLEEILMAPVANDAMSEIDAATAWYNDRGTMKDFPYSENYRD